MVNDVDGPAPVDRHIERVEDQLRAHVRARRPADDAPTERVKNDGQEQEARVGRDVGDVRDPEFVRRFGDELALDEVRSGAGIAIAHRCANALAATSALELPFVHQSREPIIADRYPVVFEFGLDSGTPVRIARAPVDGFDAIAQRNIALFAADGARTSHA